MKPPYAMRQLTLVGLAILAVVHLAPRPATAVALGQIDTFESGTTEGWFVPGPSPNPPSNSPTGGPAGVGDAFLTLVSTGVSAPGGRLSVLNDSQWAGDYLASGVTLLQMNVNNFGPDDAHLRLLFEDVDGPGPPANLALSAAAVVVPANSGWLTVAFPIAPGDLVVETFGTVTGALSDTDRLRIFHNPDAAFPGPGVGIPLANLTLGVDNICAATPGQPCSIASPVPMPSTGWLQGAAVLAWLLRAGAVRLGARRSTRRS